MQLRISNCPGDAFGFVTAGIPAADTMRDRSKDLFGGLAFRFSSFSTGRV